MLVNVEIFYKHDLHHRHWSCSILEVGEEVWQQDAVLNYTTCQLITFTSADNVHVTDDELLCGTFTVKPVVSERMNECMYELKGSLRGCGPHDGAMCLWVEA